MKAIFQMDEINFMSVFPGKEKPSICVKLRIELNADQLVSNETARCKCHFVGCHCHLNK